jgi:hypothetical protein
LFSKKSKPFDLDRELLVALDKAIAAGMSARTIAAAFQGRADGVRQADALVVHGADISRNSSTDTEGRL